MITYLYIIYMYMCIQAGVHVLLYWISTFLHFATQKYLHESRHRHAIKRHRGYSGRFSGKEQSESPQKSPKTPNSGSLPLSTQCSSSQSEPGVGCHQSSVGARGLFPPARNYTNVTTTSSVAEELMGAVMQQMHVVPEMCAAGGAVSPSKSSQTVSLVPNQLGTSSMIESSGVESVVTTVSSGEHSSHQCLSDAATIQGLINATRHFVVPILPPNLSPLVSSPLANNSVEVSRASVSSAPSLPTQPPATASITVGPDSTVPSVTQAST